MWAVCPGWHLVDVATLKNGTVSRSITQLKLGSVGGCIGQGLALLPGHGICLLIFYLVSHMMS